MNRADNMEMILKWSFCKLKSQPFWNKVSMFRHVLIMSGTHSGRSACVPTYVKNEAICVQVHRSHFKFDSKLPVVRTSLGISSAPMFFVSKLNVSVDPIAAAFTRKMEHPWRSSARFDARVSVISHGAISGSRRNTP